METKSNKSDQEPRPQSEQKHPSEWQQDLNPNHLAGQNIGPDSDDLEQGLPTAYDVKEVHRTLSDAFQDDELRQIPVVPPGSRLQQGATYVDLRDAEQREFTATGQMTADAEHWYVPKDQVPYSLWNRLTGVENPERLAERPRDRDER